MNLEWPDCDWNALKSGIKERWPRLAEENLDLMRGAPDMLVGRLQEYYEVTKEEAEAQVQTFLT
jgi:uncharacterized protein YjbJ (UPF0337 family)